MAKQQNLNDLPVHPAAELFPLMPEAEFEALKEDIRVNGQNDDIVLWDGQLLDGRHRLRACTELGIEPSYTKLPKAIDPIAWVVSHNLHRRHLTTAQRAMVADKLAILQNGEKKTATGIPVAPPSQAEAAAMLNVSVDSVQKARKVRSRASKKVIAAVERGEMSLNAALETTKKSEAEKAAKEAKREAEKAAKAKEKAEAKLAKEAERAAAKEARAKAKEQAKADAKAAREKAKADAKAAKMAALPKHEQAALIRNMIQQHIDRAVRLLDDLHRIRPNHAVRSVSVKALQGIKMW